MSCDTSFSAYENESKPFVRFVQAGQLFPMLRLCEEATSSRGTVHHRTAWGVERREFDRNELLWELRRILKVKPEAASR